jgi:hypothetical protein
MRKEKRVEHHVSDEEEKKMVRAVYKNSLRTTETNLDVTPPKPSFPIIIIFQNVSGTASQGVIIFRIPIVIDTND